MRWEDQHFSAGGRYLQTWIYTQQHLCIPPRCRLCFPSPSTAAGIRGSCQGTQRVRQGHPAVRLWALTAAALAPLFHLHLSGQQHCRNRSRGAGQLGLPTGLKTSNSDGNAAGTLLAQRTCTAANVIKSSLNANLKSKSLETSVLDGCQEHPESSCFKSLQT